MSAEASRLLIRDFVRAAARGDFEVARRLVSPAFGRHDGKGADAWLRHEASEYAARASAFGIDDESEVVLLEKGLPGLVTFAVVGAGGELGFEDALGIGPDGLVVGNQRAFEIVSKLAFVAPGRTRRSLAIRGHGMDIMVARPETLRVDDLVLEPCMTWHEDRFRSMSFTIPGDDFLGRVVRFTLFGENEDSDFVREKSDVWLRGRDDPFFEDGLFPIVEGRTVTVSPGRLKLWSVSVAGEEPYMSKTIDNPPRGTLTFDHPVRMAVVTDALDNDWYGFARGAVHG